MPIFKHKGQQYNVDEADIKDFASEFPDAYTVAKDKDGVTYRVAPGDWESFQQKPVTPKGAYHNQPQPELDEMTKSKEERSPSNNSMDLGGLIDMESTIAKARQTADFAGGVAGEIKAQSGNPFPPKLSATDLDAFKTPEQKAEEVPDMWGDAFREHIERSAEARYKERMKPYISTYPLEEQRQLLNSTEGFNQAISAVGIDRANKMLKSLNEGGKAWVEADEKQWTPEDAAKFRKDVIESTLRDPIAIVPESFKQKVDKKAGSKQPDEVYFAEWLNLKGKGREDYLHAETVRNLLEPSDEDAKRLNGIKERAEANTVSLSDKLRNNDSFVNWLGGSASPLAAAVVEDSYDISRQTTRALDKAEEIKEAYVNHQNDENFFLGAGKGVKDGLTDVDNWVGAYMVGDMNILTNLVGKIDRGEKLTQQEEDYMDAQAYKLAVEAAMADDLGWGYKSGNVTGVSVPFMLQMLASPVSSTTGAVANRALVGLGKRAVNKFGGTILKNLLAKTPKAITKVMSTTASKNIGKGLSRIADATTAGAAQTMLFNADRTFADAADRHLGNQAVVGRTNEQYGTNLEAQEGESWAKAIFKSAASNTSMNASEYLGSLLISPLLTRYGDHLAKPLRETLDVLKPEGLIRAAKRTGAAKAIQTLENLHRYVQGTSRLVDDLARQAEYDGLISEYLEEVADNVVNTAIGDMSVEDLLSPKQNAETILGLSWTSGAFNVLNKVTRTTSYITLSRKMKKADAVMREAAPEKWEKYVQELGKARKFDDIIGIYENFVEELSGEGNVESASSNIAEATRYTAAYAGKMGHDAMLMSEDKKDIESLLSDARENGYSLADAQMRKEAYDRMKLLEKRFGSAIEPKIEEFGGPAEFLRSLEGNVSDEAFGAVVDYLLEKERYEGIKDARADDLAAKQEASRKRIDRDTHKPSGTVITASTTDPVTKKTIGVTVVNGDLSVDANTGAVTPGAGTVVIRYANGKYGMVDISTLTGFTAMNAEALKAAFDEKLSQQEQTRVQEEESGATQETTTGAEAGAAPSATPTAAAPETAAGSGNSADIAAELDKTEEGRGVKEQVDAWFAQGEEPGSVEQLLSSTAGSFAPLGMDYYNALAAEAAANAAPAAEPANAAAPAEGVGGVSSAPTSRIMRKKGDIDAEASFENGATVQEMADAYAQEYGEEEGLPLRIAQEQLALIQEEREKTKDLNRKHGSLRKKEKFWNEVVDLLTPKEAAPAEESRQETVGTPVALQYLLEGGKGSIENAGYFFYAIQAAFPHIGAPLQEIRNSMPAEMLGMAPDAFVASNPSQLQEVRRLVEATYGEAGTRILDQMLANSTGFYPREGKALDLEIENLKPVEGTKEEISENEQNESVNEQNESVNEQNELEKAEKERIDALVPTIEDVADDMQTADEFVAGLFGNGIRITPESFRKETGLGWEEQRRLVGIIAGKEKGGLTVEQAAETIVENYRAELAERGFSGDSMEMRDMVIDILSSGNPRAYAKEAAARRAEQALHREMEAFDRYTQEAFHMSAEEYIMYEESMLPKYIEQYKDFDEQEYYSNFADEQSTQNEHDTTRESAETGGSREILSEEQPSATTGEGTAGEGQQGGTLQGDVQGDAQERIARAEAGQEVAEQPAENKNRTRFSTSMFEDAERIAREEQRRAPLRRTARAWEKLLGVKVTLMERLEDVKDPVARREIEAAEKKGKNVPGWYSDTEGVFLYLPHVKDVTEVDKTCVHEIVSHKGLKELLGQEKFDELCRKVWGIMSPAARKKYSNYPNVHNELEAADEYIAHLSENVELTARERSVWQKIMDFFAGLLGRKADNRSKAASIVGKETLSRKDIAELVRLSYSEYLQRNGRESEKNGEENVRFNAKKKRALETVSTPGKKHQQTVISSANGAKVLNNLDNLAEKYENDTHTKEKTFIGEVAKAIGARKQGSGSQYATFEAVNGNVVTIRLADHNATVSNFDYRNESEGISIVVSARDNNGIINDGEAHIVEYFYDSIDLRRSDGKPLAEIVKSIKQSLYSGEFKDTTGLAERQEVNGMKFRVLNDKNGKKTLVGLHNISEAKLRKAISLGGLANPSMAVIDLDKQSHVDYGEITLVAPESLVDKKTGKNVGTFLADAYTPIYPTVVKKMPDKAGKVLTKALESVDETFRSKVRTYFNSYLDSGTVYDALFYWYLSDTGKNPPILEASLPDGYTREEVKKLKEVNPEATIFADLSESERRKVIDLYIEKEGGNEKYESDLAKRIEGWKNAIEDENAVPARKAFSMSRLNEYNEYGYEYNRISNYYSYAIRLANASSKPSEVETFRNAYDEVVKNGLEEDFGNWLMGKEAEMGVEEKLFAGYGNQGRAKYLPNTLENASKLMKKEGRAGATGLGGFNYFVAILAPLAKNTKEISKKKENLSTQEEYDAFSNKWHEYYHRLALQLQPGADKWADYGYHRLHEIAPMANPKDYVKREYGIDLSDKFMKDLNEVKSAIKNDFPARYFETKFERPVYLNEFAAAVVPNDISLDLYGQLQRTGIPLYEYERGNNESRMEAVDKVTVDNEGIRFRVSNDNQEIFVSNAQRAVEGIKQEKGTPQQWLAMIEKNGGLKAGEDKWLGLSDWLKGMDKKSVTKDEILDFIGENKIRIEEVTYGEEAGGYSEEKLDEFNAEYEELIWEGEEETGSIYANDWADYAYEAMVARYGDDFRNAFDTEGVGTGSRLVPHYYYDGTLSEEAKQFVGEEGANDNEINSTRLEYTTEGLDNKQEIALTVPTIEPWNQSDDIHFGEAGGGRAVAWIRFGEANDADGNSVLVIDEIQSKRHQEGREKGYNNPRVIQILDRMNEIQKDLYSPYGVSEEVHAEKKALQEELEAAFESENPQMKKVAEHIKEKEARLSELNREKAEKENDENVEMLKLQDRQLETRNVREYDYYEQEINNIREAQERRDDEIDELRSSIRNLNEEYSHYYNSELRNARIGVMPAPFEKNWHELAMKRMLRYAAENGFDKVAWTMGAQQAERYNLGKYFSDIEREDNPSIEGRRFVLHGGNVEALHVDESGNVIESTIEEAIGKPLVDVVGKSMADRMMSMDNGDMIEGEDLRIGGEGMKGFYDKMLPSFVQKYTKKWGAKVGEVELPHLEEGAQKMWSVDVTPEMKESVMEGQTMFRVTDDSPADAMRRAYDGEMRTARFLTKETMVDYLASVKALLDTIAKKTGKGITDPQNVYRAMLTLTNKNTQELAAFDYGVLPHLTKAIAGILGKEWNGDWDAPEAATLQRYAKVKHGIERDRDMAVRRAIPRMAEQKYRDQFGELDRMIAADTDAEALEALRTKKAAMLADPKAYGMQTADEIAEQMEQQWYDRIAWIRRGEGTWREKQQRMDAAIAVVFDLDAEGLETYGLTLTEDYSGLTETLIAEGEIDRKTARKVSGAVRAAAYDFVEQYEERTGADKTDALWDGVRAVSDFSLEKQRRTGLVDAKYVEDCNRRYEFYVPLRNFAETTADEVYDYLDETYNDNNPVKTARGRRSEAGNPFSNVMMLGYQSITAGNKNAAVQHFWNLASRPDVKGFLVPSRPWRLAELDDAQREEVNRKVGNLADIKDGVVLPHIPGNATARQAQEMLNDFEDVMKDLKKRGLAFQGKKRARQEYRLTSKQQANAHRVKVYVNGEARYVTIVGDPRAALALNGKLNPESGVPEKYKAMQQFLSGAFTSQNPSFALANIIRDTQHANMRAFITESGRYWAKFSAKQAAMMKPGRLAFLLAKYENSMGNTGRHGWGGELDMRNETHRNFKRFMELGGATGYTFSHKEIENLKKLADMAERAEGKTPKGQGYVVGEIFDFIRLCSESAELINRFAAFEASLEMGRSEQRAISDAQEITLNFSRKGAGKKTYNPERKGKTWLESRKYNAVNAVAWLSQFGRDHIIFWNATVQGSYQTYKMLREHTAKTAFALAGVPIALSVFALPALNAMICAFMGDDEDAYYNELPDYVRQRNICIKVPGGWFKIPLDPATQKVWAAGDAAGAAWRGKRQIDYWGDLGANAVGLFSPVDIYWGDRNDNLSERALSAATSFTPTLIQPLLHSYANRDWKGKPLYNDSRYIDQLPSYAKSFKSDKESLKALSKFLNDVGNSDADSYGRTWHDFAPPGVMEELLYGYTGGYGQLALAAVEGAIAIVSDDAKGNFRWDNMPVVNRLWVEGDPGQTRLNIYRNYRDTAVDFMENVEQRRSQINREYKEAKRSHDTFAEAEALVKMKQLYDGDYQRYEILNNSDKLFQKYMKGSRIEDVPDFVIKGMLEAIEIVNNPDGEKEEKKSENDK